MGVEAQYVALVCIAVRPQQLMKFMGTLAPEGIHNRINMVALSRRNTSCVPRR